MRGSFVKQNISTGYYKFISDGTKFGPTKNTAVSYQFRSYLNLGEYSIDTKGTQSLRIIFDETPTSVNAATSVEPQTLQDGKYLQNGNVTIVKGGNRYNTLGLKY